MGMKSMEIARNDVITHPGIKIGFQAGSCCCVNLESGKINYH